MAALFDPEYFEDAEIIYWPHWEYWDSGDSSKLKLVNSAGGTFGKPIVEPLSVGIVHVKMYETGWSAAKYKSQLNACNNDSWRSWPAGQAWISRIITEEAQVNGTNCHSVHRIIRCNEYGWNTGQLEMGYFYKEGGDIKPFSDDGIPLGLLKTNGDKATSASDVAMTDKRIKRRISFGGLGF